GHNRLQCRSQTGYGHLGRGSPPAARPASDNPGRARHHDAHRLLANHAANCYEINMIVSTQDDELEKFSALADRWWDPQGDMRPLHDINPLRLDYIDTRARLSGARVADIGCGAGILSEAMAGRGAEVTAIDLSQAMIDTATHHAGQSGLDIDYRCLSSRDLAASMRGQFDSVICMEMLEHADEPAAIVDDCMQLV